MFRLGGARSGSRRRGGEHPSRAQAAAHARAAGRAADDAHALLVAERASGARLAASHARAEAEASAKAAQAAREAEERRRREEEQERARREALCRMLEDAQRLGATAVINVRYETANIGGMGPNSMPMAEVVAYGTAVFVAR